MADGTTERAAAERAGAEQPVERLTAADLDVRELGERATLVQFSSAFCRPCAATRRILADVAGMVAGVAYADVDAESHLGLVRRLEVTRTPTVLVLDADGRVVRRAAGLPRKADVIAALGAAITGEQGRAERVGNVTAGRP
ncbi:thioredoxin [Streptomyces sp. WAC 06738]|uniref:TlpA family protein disulfide reductase n=1 Tax=Streptomyces sp. WAC 06738 TaxID=2203210 RepID=UPI000F71E1B1|nr:thioredoxin family protein [Streptomyces sp. WAC 06738]AZM50524.1 thioredoxin [Streptomyces sp. WAC 06738]